MSLKHYKGIQRLYKHLVVIALVVITLTCITRFDFIEVKAQEGQWSIVLQAE